MQGDAAVGIASWSAIFQIALYGAAHLGQLASYLVVASCVQVYFQQVVSVARGYQFIIQHCLLGTRHLSVVGTCRVVLFLAGKPVCQRALGRLWAVLDYCPIGLAYIVVLGKHLVQAWQGLACLGKKHHARYGPVQTVHYAKVHVARFVVLLL